MLMESPHKKPLTISEIKAICAEVPLNADTADQAARLHRIEEEFARGFEFIDQMPKSISFFGSSKTTESDAYYQQARDMAAKLVKSHDYGIITGGGPGIMEAANRGALEAGGISAGLTIQLPTTQAPNPYLNRRCDYHYFFIRKVILSFAARIYVFFPGGFGTLNEFFEIVTLIQTNKIQAVPVVCVGTEYWQPMVEWLRADLLTKHHTIDEADLKLFTITDSEDLVLELAQFAQNRD